MIPNNDALYQHWKRVCWVLDLWHQADRNTMLPKLLPENGWKVQDRSVAVDWDSDVNMDAIREHDTELVKGCQCKTGCQTRQCRELVKGCQCKTGCQTRQCRCKGKGKSCGEGCNSINCTNTDTVPPNTTDRIEETSIEEIIQEEPPEDLDEIMEGAFADYRGEGVNTGRKRVTANKFEKQRIPH